MTEENTDAFNSPDAASRRMWQDEIKSISAVMMKEGNFEIVTDYQSHENGEMEIISVSIVPLTGNPDEPPVEVFDYSDSPIKVTQEQESEGES